MRKFLVTSALLFTLFSANTPALADTVNMFNGTVVKGKIYRITSEIINMKTKQGHRKFSRIQVLNNRDFVELGFGKRRIITGKIFFANQWAIEMHTPEGVLKLSRFKIRNIVLGHVHQPEEQLQIQLPQQVEKSQRDINQPFNNQYQPPSFNQTPPPVQEVQPEQAMPQDNFDVPQDLPDLPPDPDQMP